MILIVIKPITAKIVIASNWEKFPNQILQISLTSDDKLFFIILLICAEQ